METMWKGTQCTDPKLQAGLWKEWGLIFCCPVLEYHRKYLLRRFIYQYWSLLAFPWDLTLFNIYEKSASSQSCPWVVRCIVHWNAKQHLLLERVSLSLKEGGCEWNLPPWTELWSDAPTSGGNACSFLLIFCWGQVGKGDGGNRCDIIIRLYLENL